MKLKASNEKDIQILSIHEQVTARDVQVLKAGITSLFKNGKNKIILDFQGAVTIPPEVIRELAFFEVLARELSGRIVVCGVTPLLKGSIEQFAKPPVLSVFVTRAEALASFGGAQPVDEGKVLSASAPAATAAPSASSTSEGHDPKELTILKEQLRDLEKTQLGPLRKRIADLERENEAIRSILVKFVHERKLPPNAAALEGRIQVLEAELEKELIAK